MLGRGQHLQTSGDAGRLEVRSISVRFAGVVALEGVDLDLKRREIVGLIGPNGAGKTTLMNVLTGFQRPAEGRVLLDGRDTTTWSPHRLAHAGVGRTFQSIRLFRNLTVLENVESGAIARGVRRSEARRLAWDALERLGLDRLADMSAGSLSQGEERQIGLLRALATSPAFVFLDEPAAGLSTGEAETMMKMIATSRDELSCGVLVIEHDMKFIMRLCERLQVIDHGRTICIGNPEQVRADSAVRDAYLGHESSPGR
jgi:ABC-type branched-subunit amino acid transport system ATPase component